MKVGANVRKIEVRSILLRQTVNSIQVADALSLNQCTDGSTADAQSTALRSRPLRFQFPIANEIEITFESQRCSAGSVHPHQGAGWVKGSRCLAWPRAPKFCTKALQPPAPLKWAASGYSADKKSQPTLQPTPWMEYCCSTSGYFFEWLLVCTYGPGERV